jgi:hypothetical protein
MALTVKKFLPWCAINDIAMSVACQEGDHITATGVLADSDGATLQSVGVASRTVSSADVTAGGDRAKVSAYPIAVLGGYSSLTAGNRRYVKNPAGSAVAGDTTTTTRPATAGNLVQPVEVAVSATDTFVNCFQPCLVVQAAATTTVAFG